jgi:predicted signal transduction protein with EAL and GGDEF domain
MAKSTNIKLALAWLAVGVPLLWGVVETLRKASALFA